MLICRLLSVAVRSKSEGAFSRLLTLQLDNREQRGDDWASFISRNGKNWQNCAKKRHSEFLFFSVFRFPFHLCNCATSQQCERALKPCKSEDPHPPNRRCGEYLYTTTRYFLGEGRLPKKATISCQKKQPWYNVTRCHIAMVYKKDYDGLLNYFFGDREGCHI